MGEYQYEDIERVEQSLEGELSRLETDSYKPLRFTEIIKGVRALALSLGMEVVRESFGISGNCREIFGLCVLSGSTDNPEYCRSIGFISSHNKKRALWISGGIEVNVCSNGLLSSDGKVIRKLHTPKLNLEQELNNVKEDIVSGWHSLDAEIIRLKGIKDFNPEKEVLDLYKGGVIPHTLLLPIIHEFNNPTYPEFSERSKWSFVNAITHCIKGLSSYRQGLILRSLGIG